MVPKAPPNNNPRERSSDMKFTFQKTRKDLKAMATFTAQLVREGVTFTVENTTDSFIITMTGGF
jgi:hypothetical protein